MEVLGTYIPMWLFVTFCVCYSAVGVLLYYLVKNGYAIHRDIKLFRKFELLRKDFDQQGLMLRSMIHVQNIKGKAEELASKLTLDAARDTQGIITRVDYSHNDKSFSLIACFVARQRVGGSTPRRPTIPIKYLGAAILDMCGIHIKPTKINTPILVVSVNLLDDYTQFLANHCGELDVTSFKVKSVSFFKRRVFNLNPVGA